MGAQVSNIGTLVDHSSEERFIEIHRAIPVSSEQQSEFNELMESGKLIEAKAKLISYAPENAKAIIEAAFDDLISHVLQKGKSRQSKTY